VYGGSSYKALRILGMCGGGGYVVNFTLRPLYFWLSISWYLLDRRLHRNIWDRKYLNNISSSFGLRSIALSSVYVIYHITEEKLKRVMNVKFARMKEEVNSTHFQVIFQRLPVETDENH
jgi:hypothetical protein